jgi:zinc protease
MNSLSHVSRGRWSAGLNCNLLGAWLGLICWVAAGIAADPAVADPASAGAETPPRLERFELLNGLRVITSKRESDSTLAVHLLIKTGSATNHAEEAGLALVLAELLSQPLEGSPAVQFLEAEIPFSIVLFPDAIVLRVETSPNALEFTLRALARLVTSPPRSQKGLESVLHQIRQSRLERPDPMEVGREKFLASLFGRHPYGRSIWGGEERFKGTTLESLQRFHLNYFRPNNAALILAGSLEDPELNDVVRACLGSWVKSALPDQRLPEFIPSGNSAAARLSQKEMTEAALFFGLSAPPRLSAAYYELELLNLILSGIGHSSRLRQELARAGAQVTQVNSRFEFYQAGGLFLVTIKGPAAKMEVWFQAVENTLEGLKRAKVSGEELQAAKTEMLRMFRQALGQSALRAEQITAMELFDLASDFLVAFPGRVEKISEGNLQDAAKQYLITTRLVTVTVAPPSTP